MSAVVQQDHVPASYLPGHLLLDVFNRWRIPVVAGYVPHNRFKTHLAGDAQHRGAPGAKRRAEQIGVLADCAGQSALTAAELFPDLMGALECQRWMSHGVVSDNVSGAYHFAGNVRALLHETADHEKSGMHIVFSQDFQ